MNINNKLHQQKGLTLVELLVALAISSIIAIAAIAALTVGRQGFAIVDAASQLRDNARFAADIIQKLTIQTGYQDVVYAATTRNTNVVGGATADPESNISGFTNATPSASDPLNSYTSRTSGSIGYGSDILILRYQTGETFPGSGISDKTMIDCSGNPTTVIPVNRDDRMVNVIHLALSRGEPSLMCTTINPTTGTVSDAQPLVNGVESFQVLYGIDADNDSITERYMRADQLIVSGNTAATNANWRMVRSVKIGLILRSAEGSTQETATQTLYPFGVAKSSASSTTGSAFADNTNDPGTVFSAAADRRLRQQTSFTIHLRNEQSQ